MRKGRRTVVHLLSYIPMRRTPDLDIIEDPVPLVDMALAIRLPHSPKRVFLAPNERGLTFDYRNGCAHTRITTSEGHALMVFET